MTVTVFVGPTLSAAEVRAELDAVVLGPAAFGDVCRAAQSRPTAIAIVDGYFERVPAVWHKEILWAMSEGVHLFGSSSMGALRAAELADFGMEGIGKIYEAYRAGELEDDDEVAVVHGPAEGGYVPLSEAMVNVRATLASAKEAGILSEATQGALLRIAKARFYGDRSYAAMIVEAGSGGVDARELQALREWLPRGRVDQKREDARLLLRHVRSWMATGPKRRRVPYRFEPTDAWHEAHRTALAGFAAGPEGSTGTADALIEELKISGLYAAARDGASARGAAVDQARRAGVRPDGAALRAAVEEFRRERGLVHRADFDRWRGEQGFDDTALARFFEDQARLQWARPLTDAIARDHLLDHLRATGEYARLIAKAESKMQRLAALGVLSPSLSDAGMTESALWCWYFEERLGRKIPDNLETFAKNAGFSGRDDMRVAALRELHCVREDVRDDEAKARAER
jgi:hypothetical protein